MPLLANFQKAVGLRTRLLKRVYYRVWKSYFLVQAQKLIAGVEYETKESLSSSMPAIVLATFNRIQDYLILAYLFRDRDLAFIAPRSLPDEKMIHHLLAVNHVVYFEQKIGYSFFRNLLSTLRDFNRTVVASLEAARSYARYVLINPAVLIRIAMKANVPIIPVTLSWQPGHGTMADRSKCKVRIGKQMFISPRTAEFKDIFFKKRGVRKFSRLPNEDLTEIANRVMSKLAHS